MNCIKCQIVVSTFARLHWCSHQLDILYWTKDGALWFWSVIKTIMTDYWTKSYLFLKKIISLYYTWWKSQMIQVTFLFSSHTHLSWFPLVLVGIGEHKSSKIAHFVFKCNKEDYLSPQLFQCWPTPFQLPQGDIGTSQAYQKLQPRRGKSFQTAAHTCIYALV